MHSLHLLYPLLNLLRIASLDSHHWWNLENSPLIRRPWWMYVSWCVTSKLFWFWFWFWLRYELTKNRNELFKVRVDLGTSWPETVPLVTLFRNMASEVQREVEENKTFKKKKTVEPGIIYISRIPTLMNVNIVRRYFERFGEIGRIFLQPDSK